MWAGKLTNKELKTLQSLFGEETIVGARTTDYFEFRCTSCGEYVDITYQGGDPAIPYFTYKCECGNKGQYKINDHRVHNLPL